MAIPRALERILTKPKDISRKTWREALRNAVGPSGERLWAVMLDIAEGRSYRPTWRDDAGIEHVGEPIAPTARDRLAAAEKLAHMLFGSPVAQTEALKAETEARDLEAARALTDSELEARVRRALNPGAISDAEIIEKPNT